MHSQIQKQFAMQVMSILNAIVRCQMLALTSLNLGSCDNGVPSDGGFQRLAVIARSSPIGIESRHPRFP